MVPVTGFALLTVTFTEPLEDPPLMIIVYAPFSGKITASINPLEPQ